VDEVEEEVVEVKLREVGGFDRRRIYEFGPRER